MQSVVGEKNHVCFIFKKKLLSRVDEAFEIRLPFNSLPSFGMPTQF
jgi:hypothetical protein